MGVPVLLDMAQLSVPDIDGDGKEETLIVKKYRIRCEQEESLGYCYGEKGKKLKPGTVVEYWQESEGIRHFRGFDDYGTELRLSSGKQLSDITLDLRRPGIVVIGCWNDAKTPDWMRNRFQLEKSSNTDWTALGSFDGSATYFLQGLKFTQNLKVQHHGLSRDYMMAYGLSLSVLDLDHRQVPTYKKGDNIIISRRLLGSKVAKITDFHYGLGILDAVSMGAIPATHIPALEWFQIFIAVELPDGENAIMSLQDLKFVIPYP